MIVAFGKMCRHNNASNISISLIMMHKFVRLCGKNHKVLLFFIKYNKLRTFPLLFKIKVQ